MRQIYHCYDSVQHMVSYINSHVYNLLLGSENKFNEIFYGNW